VLPALDLAPLDFLAEIRVAGRSVQLRKRLDIGSLQHPPGAETTGRELAGVDQLEDAVAVQAQPGRGLRDGNLFAHALIIGVRAGLSSACSPYPPTESLDIGGVGVVGFGRGALRHGCSGSVVEGETMLFLYCFVVAAAVAPSPLDGQEGVLVAIRNQGAGNPATGVHLGDGVVLTSEALLGGDNVLSIPRPWPYSRGTNPALHEIPLYMQIPEWPLALVWVPSLKGPAISLANKAPRAGSTVYICCYHHRESSVRMSAGKVERYDPPPDNQAGPHSRMKIAIPGTLANMVTDWPWLPIGAPVIDDQGRLVGVVLSYASNGGVDVLRIEQVREFLGEAATAIREEQTPPADNPAGTDRKHVYRAGQHPPTPPASLRTPRRLVVPGR